MSAISKCRWFGWLVMPSIRNFAIAIELLQCDGDRDGSRMRLKRGDAIRSELIPDVIVLAASRPGMIRARDVESCGDACRWLAWFRCSEVGAKVKLAPVDRCRAWFECYWYDFPNWWRRQLALLAAGQLS